MFGCDFGKKLPENAPGWLKKLGTFPEWHYDHGAGKFLDEASFRLAYSDPNVKPQILTGSPAWVQHRETDPIVNSLHHSLPVHPTQLYESLCGLLLLATLFWARHSIKKREAEGKSFFRGELFVVFTFGYGLLRFLLEIVRDDAERGLYGITLEPQILYPLALMVMALAFTFGLSNIFEEKYRTVARVLAILIPVAVFFVLKPANRFDLVEKVQLSTSQWIALLTGTAAAIYYRRGYDLALADPESAADLGPGVPELLEMEAAMERGEDPEAVKANREAAAAADAEESEQSTAADTEAGETKPDTKDEGDKPAPKAGGDDGEVPA
jgi:phosphatidylglycerol:prolipoprotein diacylglycerol transferase